MKMAKEIFECKILGDNFDIYLKSDIADIFENFRTVYLKQLKLDPRHYYMSRVLFGIRKIGIKLELLIDIDMIHFFVVILEVVSVYVVSDQLQPNNKYLKHFNPTEPTS